MELGTFIKGLERLSRVGDNVVYISPLVDDLKKIEKSQKVTVPQFVADWYEKYKDNLEYNIWDWLRYTDEPEKLENMKFSKWLSDFENDPVETLVKMKLYGYTVDKEPKYTVKIKGKIEENLLVYGWGIKRYFFCENLQR